MKTPRKLAHEECLDRLQCYVGAGDDKFGHSERCCEHRESATRAMIEFGDWAVQTLLERGPTEALRRISQRLEDIKGGKFE